MKTIHHTYNVFRFNKNKKILQNYKQFKRTGQCETGKKISALRPSQF